MGNSRRLHKNKQRGMNRRLLGNKRPMSAEQKVTEKKRKEIQRAETKARVAKENNAEI